jgi:hypothetical protein
LQIAAFGARRGLRGLYQNASKMAIAFGRVRAAGNFGAFGAAGADAGPTGETVRRRERWGGGTDFGHDLTGRFQAEAGHFGQAQDGVAMGVHGLGGELLPLFDVAVEQGEALEKQSEQLLVERRDASVESLLELVAAAAQAAIAEFGQRGGRSG